MTLLAAILLAFHPLDNGVVRESVDLIEVNHLYDEQGRLTLTQWIAWETSGRCIAWRMNNEHKLDPVWRVTWFVDAGIVRRVEARTVVETFTQYDPELADRDLLCREKRRELRAR